MKHFIGLMAMAALTAACQGQAGIQGEMVENEPIDSKAVEANAAVPTEEALPNPAMKVPPDGKITVTTEPLASEPAACIIPIRISNGTDAEASVSMFAFSVTGPGNDDSGNMFPQIVPPGEYRTARIIQLGQSCAAFDLITTKDVLCKQDGSPCEVVFEDGPEMAIKRG